MEKTIYTPSFDQTIDRDELQKFDATICDFGKFANSKLCKIKKTEDVPNTPTVTVGYVSTGYVTAGYFVTQAA